MNVNSYSREAAISDGRLLDVSRLNRENLNPFPTFVTVGLWNACQRARSWRSVRKRHREGCPPMNQEERIRRVITLVPLVRWLERGLYGEFTMYFHSDEWLKHPLPLRVVVEPDEDCGRVVVILLEGERLDFSVPRPPNGGSFFVM